MSIRKLRNKSLEISYVLFFVVLITLLLNLAIVWNGRNVAQVLYHSHLYAYSHLFGRYSRFMIIVIAL